MLFATMQNEIKALRDNVVREFFLRHGEEIRSLYHPEAVWVFGSRASGHPHEESDIDMIVVSDYFKGKRFIYRMSEFLRAIDCERHVDVICYTPEEFERKKSEVGMIREALEKAVKIL